MADVIRIKSGSRFEDANSFSRAVKVGDLVFSSNSSGRDYRTGVISGDVVEQMLGAIDNIDRAFAAAGTSVSNAVRVQISFCNSEDQEALLNAFGARFKGIDPALTLICQPFSGDVKVEVEVIACARAGGMVAETIRIEGGGHSSMMT